MVVAEHAVCDVPDDHERTLCEMRSSLPLFFCGGWMKAYPSCACVYLCVCVCFFVGVLFLWEEVR